MQWTNKTLRNSNNKNNIQYNFFFKNPWRYIFNWNSMDNYQFNRIFKRAVTCLPLVSALWVHEIDSEVVPKLYRSSVFFPICLQIHHPLLFFLFFHHGIYPRPHPPFSAYCFSNLRCQYSDTDFPGVITNSGKAAVHFKDVCPSTSCSVFHLSEVFHQLIQSDDHTLVPQILTVFGLCLGGVYCVKLEWRR